jgi:hypothetical protein
MRDFNIMLFLSFPLRMVASTALFGSWWFVVRNDVEVGRGRAESDSFIGGS